MYSLPPPVTALTPQALWTHKPQELRHPTPLQLSVFNSVYTPVRSFLRRDTRGLAITGVSATSLETQPLLHSQSRTLDIRPAGRTIHHLPAVNHRLRLRDCTRSRLTNQTVIGIFSTTYALARIHTRNPHQPPSSKERQSSGSPDFLPIRPVTLPVHQLA